MTQRLVATAAIAFLHSPLLLWLQDVWAGQGVAGAASSIVCPIVVASLLYLRRRDVAQLGHLASRFDRTGAVVMVLGGLLAAAAAVFQELLLLGASLPLSVYGYLAWTRGKQAVAPVTLPIVLLSFLAPLSESSAPSLAYGLQAASARVATWFLQLADLPSALDGVVITTGLTTNTVTQDCSGLSTLLALTLYGLVTGFVFRLDLRRSLVVLAVLLPLGLVVNAARIAFISWLLFRYGKATAEGPMHDGSGLMLFGVAYAISFFLALRLAQKQNSQSAPNAAADQSPTIA